MNQVASPANSILSSRAVITKPVAHLNDQTVAALGMEALVKAEYVFGKPAAGGVRERRFGVQVHTSFRFQRRSVPYTS
jgi:hypothetical protein